MQIEDIVDARIYTCDMELIAECPKENAKECAKLLSKIMSKAAEEVLEMPIKCDVSCTYCWYGEEIEINTLD